MSMSTTGSIVVSANVTNTGEMDGNEIVQFYIRDRVGSITRPVKELKGFQRVSIPQGMQKEIQFTLNAQDLAFFNGKAQVIEPGEFDVWIGPNSAEGLHGEFNMH
jgi:beta-glucosidase